jgi:nitrogen fixation/metabolism regulation signal transduction histidine kinase
MKLSGKLADADQALLNKSVNTIIEQVDAMKRLVNEFRDYSRLPSAVLERIDLNDLIVNIYTLYDHAQVPVKLELMPNCPFIHGDAQQIRQIIHNLVQNAQDATLAARPDGQVSIRTCVSSNGRLVRLLVSDQGLGFSEHILRRAFEPYVTTKAKGTGLGLAVVKKIAEEHKASVDLSNQMLNDVVIGGQVAVSFAVAN